MPHKLYSSIEEMLAPETLSELAGQSVQNMRCLPFNTKLSRSGNRFLSIETNQGQGPRYILKHISSDWDWIMRVTNDRHCRSVTLRQSGLLDRLKPEIEHCTIACAKEGDGWAILMQDVTTKLVYHNRPLLDVSDNEYFVDAMAAQHAIFWNATELTDPTLGLCELSGFFDSLSPQMFRRELTSSSVAPQRAIEGWELIPTVFEPDVAEILQALMIDAQPLCDALARYPQTLVHGDLNPANLGLMREEQPHRAIFLDWQFTAVAPGTVDLGWYCEASALPLASIELAIERYRQTLAYRLGSHFDENRWQPLLKLGLLSGLVRRGCWFAWDITHNASKIRRARKRRQLAWWCEQVRAAVKWL